MKFFKYRFKYRIWLFRRRNGFAFSVRPTSDKDADVIYGSGNMAQIRKTGVYFGKISKIGKFVHIAYV